jgi:hypothetical protein
VGLTFHGNGAAGILHEPFGDVEAHARALDVGVQTLKETEELPLLR